MSDWQDPEEHVDRAHELFEAGRWAEAERLLRRAISAHPDRAEWHFNLGLTLEAGGKYAEALASFTESARLNPTDVQSIIACAVNNLRLDQPAPARDLLAKARKLDPDRLDAFVHSIEALSRTGDHDGAEVMFYQALQLEGNHADAYANMGECLIERSLFEKAAACLREALKLEPGLERVQARLAYCLHKTGQSDKARLLYLRELRENPGDTETLMDLGDLLADTDRLPEASEKFRRVLELDPKNAHAHFALATIAARQQRLAPAARHLKRVLKLDPAYPSARRRLARVRLELQQHDRAIALLRREAAAFTTAPETFSVDDLRDLGMLLLDVKHHRRAARVFGVLRSRTPTDALAHHYFGVASLMAGESSRGIAAEIRAVRLDPKLLAAWHNLSLAFINARRWRHARMCLNRAIAVAPSDHGIKRLRLKFHVRRLISVFETFLPRNTAAR